MDGDFRRSVRRLLKVVPHNQTISIFGPLRQSKDRESDAEKLYVAGHFDLNLDDGAESISGSCNRDPS